MTSEDLQKLRKLLFEEKFAIQEINTKFDGESSSSYEQDVLFMHLRFIRH